MINCKWKGKIIDAEEVAKIEGVETVIRRASGNHELICSDPDCKTPLVRYKHGPKRAPHFAHINKNANCDYANFEKSDSSVVKNIRTILFNHFKSQGFDIKKEFKIPNGHKYCHLYIENSNQPIVVQISTSTTSVRTNDDLSAECKRNGYKLLWISIGNVDERHYEGNHYYAMRHQFNHTKNKNLLMISFDGKRVAQIKEDNNNYKYKHRQLDPALFGGDLNNFMIVESIDMLQIIDGELTIQNFNEQYEAWMQEKQTAFDKIKKQIDANEQKMKQIQQEVAALSAQPHTVTGSMGYMCGDSVIHKSYGIGKIKSIERNANTGRHIITIQLKDGKTNQYELETLIKFGIISKL